MNDEQPINPTPQTEPVATAPTPETNPKKNFKKFLFGGIAALALVLIAGSVFAYTAIYQNPDRMVHDAIINAIQAKTATMTGDISYKADGVNITMKLDSASTATNGEFSVTANVAIDTESYKQTFDASGAGKMVDGTLYVKLGGLQAAVNTFSSGQSTTIPGFLTDIIKKIDNQWISIKASDYQDVSKDAAEQQACYTTVMEKIQSDNAMRSEVVTLYRDNQVLVIKEELGAKEINSVDSLGFKVEVDQAAATNLIKGIGNTTFGKELKNCNDDIDFNKIADEMADASTSEGVESSVELWVSKMGHEITQVTASVKDKDNTANVVLNPLFNKEVTVEAPQDAIPLKTLIEDIQSAIMQAYMGAGSNAGLSFNASNV